MQIREYFNSDFISFLFSLIHKGYLFFMMGMSESGESPPNDPPFHLLSPFPFLASNHGHQTPILLSFSSKQPASTPVLLVFSDQLKAGATNLHCQPTLFFFPTNNMSKTPSKKTFLLSLQRVITAKPPPKSTLFPVNRSYNNARPPSFSLSHFLYYFYTYSQAFRSELW